MDNLLCNESWLSDPLTPVPLPNFHHITHDYDTAVMSPVMDESAVEEAISMDLEKETRFSNYEDKFIEFLVTNKFADERLQSIQWLIETRNRLNLTFETLFTAANCFDRFVYLINCHEWTMWMVELVAVTSLLVASKYNEVNCPSLEEIQMEGLSNMFNQKTVVEMEAIVLKVLEWRVNSVTSYSFSQILLFNIGLVDEHKMMNRVTDHLLDYLCDLEMLQYPPTVVALSALWNVIEEEPIIVHENFGRLTTLLTQEHKKRFVKCVDMTKSRNVEHWSSTRKVVEVKSFMSLLMGGDVNDYYYSEDLSAVFQILRSEKKRFRENYQDMIRPTKKRLSLRQTEFL